MTDHLDAALALAAEGVPVFPVGPNKAPRTARGFHDASIDPAVLYAWDWNGGGGIGACILPGQIVIDVDPRNGGDETMAGLKGDLPSTRIVSTRSGGWHLYFSVPQDGVYRSILGPGVDVKRSGKGYVVVPPTDGYSIVSDAPVAPAPDWLLELIAAPERAEVEGEAGDAKYFAAWEDGTAYGLKALEAELQRLRDAGPGERNNTLNRCAFALAQLAAGGELKPERAVEDLETVAEEIGLEHDETQLTLRSAWAAGEAKPRQAPELEEHERPVSALAPKNTAMPMPSTMDRRWADWNVDEPAPPFLLHPIIPKNAYVLVYGATEASKSMVFVGLCAEASRNGLRCSVYSLENPPHTDRDRLRRLGPDAENFRLTNDPLDLNDPKQLESMIEDERAWNPDIVLIDTYSHAFNTRTEDGNARAIEFARRIRWLMHEVDCSVVLIDHTGYAQVDEPRDASAKRQQVDVAILMQKQGEWVAGQPARWSMANKKSARFANPFFFQGSIRDVHTADDPRGGLAIEFDRDRPTWR